MENQSHIVSDFCQTFCPGQFTLVKMKSTLVNMTLILVNIKFTLVNIKFTLLNIKFTLVNFKFTLVQLLILVRFHFYCIEMLIPYREEIGTG